MVGGRVGGKDVWRLRYREYGGAVKPRVERRIILDGRVGWI